MAKFTSGPWTARWLCNNDWTVDGPRPPAYGNPNFIEVDARLMASAPDLYEALKAIIASLDPDNEENYRADDPEGAMDTAFEIARKALAKADGTENGE